MNLLEMNFSTSNDDLKDQLNQDKTKAINRKKRKAERKEKLANIDNILREKLEASDFKPFNPEIKS